MLILKVFMDMECFRPIPDLDLFPLTINLNTEYGLNIYFSHILVKLGLEPPSTNVEEEVIAALLQMPNVVVVVSFACFLFELQIPIGDLLFSMYHFLSLSFVII